jgi:hypothetical protein
MTPRIACLAAVFVLASAAPAAADVRPTSGDPSVLSGRTLGNGETALWFDGGFPGIRATAMFAPSSRFNLGPRAMFAYASPFMGFGTGLGASFEVPMRLLIFARDTIDLSLTATPRFVLGEGVLVGEEDVFADDFGFGGGVDLGARAGFQVADALTLTAGLAVEIGFVTVPDADDPSGLGVFTAILGLEYLLSMDVALTVEATVGGGAAPAILFDSHGVVRVFAGVAFVL